VSAVYSSGERFEYAHDATGNRTVMTSTTPLSGTLVTHYTYDDANRLTNRAVSDGRSYAYDWSNQGQLLREWTQGVLVRTFTYDGAGRLDEATVFTLTTRFMYNGLGARMAVEVVGHDTTQVVLDYAGGNRILAEKTSTGTVQYLYGHGCLGEYRDGEWLYYLDDGSGYVRQGANGKRTRPGGKQLAVRSQRHNAGRARGTGESPGVWRGVRLEHGADLQGRAVL
jgi:YD repeat-containing protein